MEMQFKYLGRSQLREVGTSRALELEPNLNRDPVSFDAALHEPLRFREAISALHDVVVSDLRFKPRDKSAYEEWKRQETARLAVIRRETYKQVRDEILTKRDQPIDADFEREFHRRRKRYWSVRDQYSRWLLLHNRELWRLLTPCDPIVTVADDAVYFECFSVDESSYGCLTVLRDGGFGPADGVRFGTTNVDYSWELFNQFQQLRTYRETRFRIDPAGFEVATSGRGEYREEKIDLPSGWLRGLMQVQVAMSLPLRRVTLSRECVYSLLAWLKRHKARKSPRALRFELSPGKAPKLVLEPWEQSFESLGTKYDGPEGVPIRVWGTRRLLALARALPLIERVQVFLLGTGLPSFWVADLGSMQMTLGLSGWTTNDWTHGSALDLLQPPIAPPSGLINRLTDVIRERRAVTLDEVTTQCQADAPQCAAALHRLAHTGQVMFDLAASRYRWRQLMPSAIGEDEMGPENPEQLAARQLVREQRVNVDQRAAETVGGLRLWTGRVEHKPVEMLLDADGAIRRAKCLCGHFQKAGLRMGPCRHLLALRQVVLSDSPTVTSLNDWYEQRRRWSGN